LRFILAADEPANGSSLLESLILKFYKNDCGYTNLVPFLTVNLPINNFNLLNGYYVFSLSASDAASLHPVLDNLPSTSGVYVGASITVSRDDNFATTATAGEILYVSKVSTSVCGPISVNATTQSYQGSGGNGIVKVISSGCLWAATTNVSWITINTGQFGSSGDAVKYTVAAVVS